MAALPPPPPSFERYVVIHVATTCDEHGVYVTKDSAEVIELGWILVDAKNHDEVGRPTARHWSRRPFRARWPTAGRLGFAMVDISTV